MTVEAYVAALDRLAATSRMLVAHHLGVDLPAVTIDLRRCAPGRERVFTDYVDTVTFELSDDSQLRPPPEGLTCVYGACHEIGHMVVSRLCSGRLPAVVWDEALAHHFAAHLLIPGIADVHGAGVWPDPYPDLVAREGPDALGRANGSPLVNYDASLRQLDHGLVRIRERVGWIGLADAVTGIPPERHRADLFGPALAREVNAAC